MEVQPSLSRAGTPADRGNEAPSRRRQMDRDLSEGAMPRSARSQSPGLKIETTVRVSSQATLSTFKPLKRTKIVKAKGRAVFGGGTFGKRGDRYIIGAARLGERRRDLGGGPAHAAELASCQQLRVRPPECDRCRDL
jgi:hypothetical protein